MAKALRFLSDGKAENFPRHAINLTNDGALGFMPATYIAGNLMGYKAVTVFPNNRIHGLNPHQGIVVLLDSENGMVKAILEGSTVTALRTAAVSAVATEKLSRADSKKLAVIGAGRQAFEHILSICQIRPIEKVLIYNRNLETIKKLLAALKDTVKLAKCKFEIAASPQKAVENADIVVTCTYSSTPLLRINDFQPGTHINAVGACRPGFTEVQLHDRDGLKIFMDSQHACLIEASELSMALAQGNLEASALIGEIGDCLTGNILGRTDKTDITFFKSVGLGVEDLFAADCLFQLANTKKIGSAIYFDDTSIYEK